MIALLVLLLATSLAAPARAQDSAAPGEPDIVLPEVILRIEDFSVERLTGAAPDGEESLPPARELPLPAGEEPLLAEPPAPPPPEGSTGQPAPPQQALSALAELGAGSSNHLFSQVALYGLGEGPRFSLRFLHETMDGMAGQDAGEGFSLRQDELEGALKLRLGKAGLDLDGSLREEDRGLQQQGGSFVSRLVRTGSLGVDLAWPFAEHWTLSGSVDGSFAAQLLTVQTGPAAGLAEQRVSPRLSLELRFPRFWLAVDGRYAFQAYDGQPVHRATVAARFGWELSEAMLLEGTGGWHWSDWSAPEHLIPFDLTLSLTPFPAVSIVASGGYRVEELDVGALLAENPWAVLPDPLLDDHGWFADFTGTLSFLRAFSLQAGAHLSLPREAPWPQSGLSPLDQVQAVRAAVETSLRWTPEQESFLSASWRRELAKHPAFTPGAEIRLEAGAASTKWGAHGSLAIKMGYNPLTPVTLMPELSLGAFFQASEAIRLAAEAEDLLAPFSAGGQRKVWDPFLEPGIRATFKVQINQ